jgi:sporulation-control protein
MKRVLSSIGIGGATVDTLFPRVEFSPGEVVQADVELSGGETTQDVESIYFALKARHAGTDDARLISEFTVDEAITLEPADDLSLPAEIALAHWIPLSTEAVSVWLETGLEIDWARDPTDEATLEIVPDAHTQALFDAVAALDFERQGSALVETAFLEDRPFAQKFTFHPTDDRYAAELDDIELTIMPDADVLRVFLEIDRVDDVADARDLDFDEQEIPLTFESAAPPTMRRRIAAEIEQQG